MGRTTDKKSKILDFIRQFSSENGFAPSLREIMEAVDLHSPASVRYHLDALVKEGSIQMKRTHKRSISVAGESRVAQVPIVGVVTAGVPILTVESIAGYVPWPTDENCFALRVRGDSMINAGILDGDLVIVRQQSTADNGDIVVGMINDEATVKRLKHQDGKVWLMPENPAYSPIDGTDSVILGKVKGVVRNY